MWRVVFKEICGRVADICLKDFFSSQICDNVFRRNLCGVLVALRSPLSKHWRKALGCFTLANIAILPNFFPKTCLLKVRWKHLSENECRYWIQIQGLHSNTSLSIQFAYFLRKFSHPIHSNWIGCVRRRPLEINKFQAMWWSHMHHLYTRIHFRSVHVFSDTCREGLF